MRRSICAFIVLALLCTAPAVFGQAQRGSVTVTVVAADGSRLPGATVSAESDQTLTRRTVVADDEGRAVLVGLDPAANYVVTTSLDGFNGARNENVRVRAGQDTPIQVVLADLSVTEELTVTAESPVVDLRSAITGQDITLQLTESLPTARSYQDYLQLVPGVMPATDQGAGTAGSANPASRSGMNYRDLLGEVGVSRDNYYYLEGINVNDGVQGYTRTNANTEIIQEQSVLTGGLPAEFVGAPGLVSNVITKSGGNQFTGSVNYYFQNDSLVDANKHFEDTDFETTDMAATFGGPIFRDKAWFFLSFRNVNRKDAFTDVAGEARSSERDNDQEFAKLTWAPTNKDLLTGVFLSDPLTVSGQNDPAELSTRDYGQTLGGDRYMFNYSRVFGSASLDLAYTKHDGDLDILSAIQEPGNTLTYRVGDPFTPQVDEDLGGNGNNNFETRGTEGYRGALEYFFDTSWGDHSVKFGYENGEYNDFRDQSYVGGVGGTNDWVSLGTRYLGQGVTNADIINNFTEANFDARNPSDFRGFMATFATLSSGQQSAMLAAYDLGCQNQLTADPCIAGDGVISSDELAEHMTYNSTAGNPNGTINYGRREQITAAPSELYSEGTIMYLQDTWQWKKWSANVGVRAEEWGHFATTGEEIFTFDYEYAPRISLAYDLKGDGRQRLSLYYGRYYDPITNSATQFAGSLTNRVLEEQVYVDPIQQWVSFRTRGGVSQRDADISPNTKTPYTDEIQIGYKRDLGRNMSIEANYIIRETRDIIEDYDFGLYTDPDTYPGPVGDPNSFFLGMEFFGYSAASPPGDNINFFIMTLPPGNFRDWDGLELIFRKRYSNNWQALASYSYADAQGNSSSDSNFDFAGDVLWLDPRAPNIDGSQPGLVENLFKVAGSYNFDNGIQIGANYRWNSGVIVNKTFRAFRRNLPAQVDDAYAFAGITDTWVRPDAVGQNENNPSYGLLDLRFAYLWNITGRWQADFFLDVFNVFDEQKAYQTEDQVGLPTYGEGVRFNAPRRYFLGARLRF